MGALPAWCQTLAARKLLDEIRRNPPDFAVDEYASSGGVLTRRYAGKAAGKLRRLHDETACNLFAEAEEEFAKGVPWKEAAAEANACLAMGADRVIAMVLAERIEPAKFVLTDRARMGRAA